MGLQASDIDLLLISDLYPTPKDPVRGIFVQDHARALNPFLRSVSIADLRLSGDPIELRSDGADPGIQVLQGGIFSSKLPRVLRAPLYGIWTQKAEARVLEHFKPDLVHAHGGVLSGTLARRVAARSKAPYFITEHFRMLEKWAQDPLKKRILKKNYSRANGVIGVSHHLSDQIEKFFPEALCWTIPNPIDTELFRPGPKERKKKMLFASRLDPNKGGSRTLKAFDAIHKEHPEWELELYGEGKEEERIRDYLDSRPKLKERVTFGPKLDRRHLRKKMQEASFMVLPSEYESFGLVIAESLASGTPVIAPKRTGPADILFEGSGTGIDPLDEHALEEAMERMIRAHGQYDPETLHHRIHEHFSMERVGREMSRLYESALEG